MVASSPSTRTHSWSFVYLRSVGTIAPGSSLSRRRVGRGRQSACSTRPGIEGKGDDLGLDPLLADLDGQYRTGLSVCRSDVGHRDRLAKCRRLGPARDDARPTVACPHRIAVARDPAAGHDEADETLCRPIAGDALERLAADKVAVLVELDDPAL